jgi:hypothetical protein
MKSFRLYWCLASQERLDLGGVTLNGNRIDIKLTLEGQTWFEHRTDAWLRDVRRVVKRLARHCDKFGIWDDNTGLGLEKRA